MSLTGFEIRSDFRISKWDWKRRFEYFFKVSSLGSTTTEEFEGEGGTIGSVTTDSDARQSNEKSGKVKTYRLVLKSFFTRSLYQILINMFYFGHIICS